MSYLLDTHYLIWSIFDSDSISRNIRDLIADPARRVFVSTISFWEISLKKSLGKLKLKGCEPEDIPGYCKQMDFEIVDLTSFDSSTYYLLSAAYHKDPFDRMLIWQAIQRRYTLISADQNIAKYKSQGLKILSD